MREVFPERIDGFFGKYRLNVAEAISKLHHRNCVVEEELYRLFELIGERGLEVATVCQEHCHEILKQLLFKGVWFGHFWDSIRNVRDDS